MKMWSSHLGRRASAIAECFQLLFALVVEYTRFPATEIAAGRQLAVSEILESILGDSLFDATLAASRSDCSPFRRGESERRVRG